MERLIIMAGSGGVGKTTLACSLGAHCASRGERVAVITVDPARRLADTLGVTIGGGMTEVPSIPGLHVAMLHAEETFHRIIRRYSRDEAHAQSILDNSLYRQISAATAGSQELMAVEALYELAEDPQWDRIILDTPPTRNAVDLLNAPSRLYGLFDASVVKILLKPAGRVSGMFGGAVTVVNNALRKLTGTELIQDITEFFTLASSLMGGFSERFHRVEQVMQSASWLVVSGVRDDQRAECEWFVDVLNKRSIPSQIIVNRIPIAFEYRPEDIPERYRARAATMHAAATAAHRDLETWKLRDRVCISLQEIGGSEQLLGIQTLRDHLGGLFGPQDGL